MGNLVTFGDSWPAGAELLETEVPFGAIMANHYNLDYYTYSKHGSAISDMVLQLKQYLSDFFEKKTTAVFFLTDFSRVTNFNSKGEQTYFGKTSDNIYYKWYTDYFGMLLANAIIVQLQSICKQNNIEDYYIVGWTKWDMSFTPGIDLNKIYDRGNTTCLNLFKVYNNDPTDDPEFILYDYNHYIKPNQCHPNQLGHQKIANELIKWIDYG
jgi:hypothetical protein